MEIPPWQDLVPSLSRDTHGSPLRGLVSWLPGRRRHKLLNRLHLAACGCFSTISSSEILTQAIDSNSSIIYHSRGSGVGVLQTVDYQGTSDKLFKGSNLKLLNTKEPFLIKADHTCTRKPYHAACAGTQLLSPALLKAEVGGSQVQS